MRTLEELRRTLHRIDRRGYKAYRDIQGSYALGPLELHVDHVQGDPFAAPSRIRLRLAQARAGLPSELHRSRVRRVALEDFLARAVRQALRRQGAVRHGSGKSGLVAIDAGGQEVLERTAVRVTSEWVEARLEVGLPAAGRSVLGPEAEVMLCDELPKLSEHALGWENLAQQETARFVECVENQEAIRARLDALGLVAFVADGSILPRESGASDRPLRRDAVPFRAPDSLRVTLELPNPIHNDGQTTSSLCGLGIRRGVTLIVGGGYHGKSTLLRALERGVHPHIPGDGREYVVTAPDAVKIRAEDGRRVERVDIQAFIGELPQGRSTAEFSSDDASGSTSQAANIVEALEMGSRLLLLDEDTSATNFMVRDARMQALVRKEQEPITPFVDRVRELYETLDVSCILVMGGSGDYFEVADTVIRMDEYRPEEATAEAHRVARERPTTRRCETRSPLSPVAPRKPIAASLDASRGRREVKIDAKGKDLILFGSDPIDLRQVEQLVDASQTRAIGYALYLARKRWMDGRRTLCEVVDALEALLDDRGLDELDPFRRRESHPGNFARPRRHEIAAALNRLRTVRMR
jgi:predicted ABC-class ATPase